MRDRRRLLLYDPDVQPSAFCSAMWQARHSAVRQGISLLRNRCTSRNTVRLIQRHNSNSLRTSATASATASAGGAHARWREIAPLAGVCSVTALTVLACLTASAVSGPTAVLAAESTSAAGGDEVDDNLGLVAAAHELRRSLAPPHQSLFRVVCILVYEDDSGSLHRITGTNSEPSTIGGSICAERAALCKLREATDCKRVTKVVVVSDSPIPLAPGVLCREFLSAHLPPSTPVVMSGSGADDVSLPVGGLLYEELDNLSLLTPGQTASKSRDHPAGGGSDGLPNDPSMVCVEEITNEARANSTCDCRGGATSAAPSGTTAVAQSSGDSVGSGGSATAKREAGPVAGENSGVDVCTVGELYPWRNFYGVTGRGEQLRLGFLKQQVAQDLSEPGLADALGLDSTVLEAYDSAWKATALDDRDGVHPIRYAAAALFPDGQVEVTHQIKALEYGATLDPVTLLAPAMMTRSKDGIRPSCVLLVDQFGNLHAPFAQARTFLSEHGFGDTRVVVHAEDGSIAVLKAKDLVPRVTTR